MLDKYDIARLRSAALLLREIVEKYGPAGATKLVQAALPKVPCNHWHIREVIVGGSVTEPTTGKILRSQPKHERICTNCRQFEEGSLSKDGKKRNVFTQLVPGPNRVIVRENLRPKKD